MIKDAEYIVRLVYHNDRTEEEFTGELIRCKDCKWFDAWLTTGGECNGMAEGGYVPEDGYCHNAERKEE